MKRSEARIMTSANKKLTQKAIAVVIIVTLLYGAGVTPVVMMFVTSVVLIVFLVSRRSQNREIERIFDFYLSAEAILRDEDRRWFGFEIAEVIENGELVLEGMPDPPPLHLFTLGALHHLIGNHTATAEYLSRIIEDESHDERNRTVPSPQLRRYVTLLRRIESEPSFAPQTLGAIRSLERMRRRQAFNLLAESRKSLKRVPIAEHAKAPQTSHTTIAEQTRGTNNTPTTSQVSAPPPIRDLLHDIYKDDLPTNSSSS
jgi:hypothetical protein